MIDVENDKTPEEIYVSKVYEMHASPEHPIIKEASPLYEYKWSSRKYDYEGLAVNRLWTDGKKEWADVAVIKTLKQKLRDTSKYMPHQGEQEMQRRVNKQKGNK